MKRYKFAVLACLLSLMHPKIVVAETRVVTTVAEWDTAFDNPPSSGDNLRVVLQNDLSRSTLQVPGSSVAYRILLNFATGWSSNMSVLVDCGGNSIIWTGSENDVKVVRINTLAPLVNVRFKDCYIEDRGTGANTVGVLFAKNGGGRMEFDGVRSRGFNDSGDVFFRPDSYFVQWVVLDSYFGVQGGADASHVDATGTHQHEYNNMFRDSLFDHSSSWCMNWNSSVVSTTVTSQGNQFYLCRGFHLDGAYLLSTGDYFNGLGYYNNGGSTSEGAFRIGADVSGIRGGITIKSGILDYWSSTYRYLFDARSWEYIDVDLATAPEPGNAPCDDSDGLFGPNGAILHGDANGRPGRISFRLQAPRSAVGKQCFVAEGDPNKFLTADAKTMCSGSNGNGRCTGSIEGVGLGRWRVDGDQLLMQPYSYNVLGDGTSDGNEFCSNGPGGKVVAGLACESVSDAQTGQSVNSCVYDPMDPTTSPLASGHYYDVSCVLP